MSIWRRASLAAALFTALLASCTSQIPPDDSDIQVSCRDHEGTEYNREAVYYRQSFTTSGAAEDSAADVVMVVDESGSIYEEVLWIREVVPELDYLLQSAGVGAGRRENHFSLIGFGRESALGVTGIVLSELAPQSVFLDALDKLQSSGAAEDGYAALEFAVLTTETRPDTVKQLILVTDEDRHVIRNDLDRDAIEKLIVESGYILNVVVNQGFLADANDNGSHAMGLDNNGTAYVFDGSSSSLYSTSPGGVVDFTPLSFFPNTFVDYVDLAFSVGGAAWDLRFVVEGEPLSIALARAFAEVKIAEVMSVLRVCERCLCGQSGPECQEADEVALDDCVGLVPETRCFLAGGRVLELGESAVLRTVPPDDQTLAADIILLVDESSSMTMEHAWIPDMTRQLDLALQEVNVGRAAPNRFGLVGFGGDCSDGLGLGRVVGGVGGQTFSFASNFTELSEGLTTSGRMEDGYSAIYTALTSYELRANTAKQYILITDEDRDPVDSNITRELIREALTEVPIMLNVAVNEMYSDGSLRALGIDSRGRGYVYDPSSPSLYRQVEGEARAVPDSGHGGTNQDYTQLALETGGGAWDLNILRLGGTVAASFTGAFVQVKVNEIISQLERCLNCTCTIAGPLCVPLPEELCEDEAVSTSPPPVESPFFVVLEPASSPVIAYRGTDTSLTCTASDTEASVAWTFNGGEVPVNSQLTSPEPGVVVLQLGKVQEENAGVYACLAHLGTYRDAAVLELDIYDPEQDLKLSLSPLESSRSPGESLYLSCSVAEPADFSWTFDDGPLPSNGAVTRTTLVTSVLALKDIMPENAGAYTCRAKNDDRGVMNEDTSYLTITTT